MRCELDANGPSALSGRGRVVVGLLCLAAGTLPILAAFDVGPLHQRDINGPPWLGAVAGGVFVIAGVSLFLGEAARNHPFSYVLALVILAGFAAIGNWIAFGAGPRQCSGGISGFLFGSTRAAAELECRIAFGIGAAILDGILVWMFASALRKMVGSGPLTDALEKVGQGALLLALAPLLLPMLLYVIGKSAFEGLREYRKTGRWPRNEAFIARMKGKRGGPS